MYWYTLASDSPVRLVGIDAHYQRVVCCEPDDRVHLHTDVAPEIIDELLTEPADLDLARLHRVMPAGRNVIPYPTLVEALTRMRDDGAHSLRPSPRSTQRQMMHMVLIGARRDSGLFHADEACDARSEHAWIILPHLERDGRWELWHINQTNWTVVPPTPRIIS